MIEKHIKYMRWSAAVLAFLFSLLLFSTTRVFASEVNPSSSGEKRGVTWHVNGSVTKVTEAALGEKPVFDGDDPDRGVENAEFVGWALTPNSKDFVTEANLPAVSGDTSYYAVFTIKTNFYFVVDENRPLNVTTNGYMYAGKGLVILPDGLPSSGEHWTTGVTTGFNAADYILETPTDAEIRVGLKAAYSDYDDSERYTADWRVFSLNQTSSGYDYQTVDPTMSCHADGNLLYALRLNANGGTFADGTTELNLTGGTYGTKIALSNAKAPIRQGYEFAGWTDKKGTFYDSDAVITLGRDDEELNAVWTPINYKVIFRDYNGTILSEKDNCHYGDELLYPTDPVRASDADYSYAFVGWRDDEGNFFTARTVTGDLDLTASYNETVITKPKEDNSGGNLPQTNSETAAPSSAATISPNITASADTTPASDTASTESAETAVEKKRSIVITSLTDGTGGTDGGLTASPGGSGTGTGNSDLTGTGFLSGRTAPRCVLHIILFAVAAVLLIFILLRRRKEHKELSELERLIDDRTKKL